MYSPKICEGLVRVLYRWAKVRGVPMTKLVDEFIRKALENEQLPGELRDLLTASGGTEVKVSSVFCRPFCNVNGGDQLKQEIA